MYYLLYRPCCWAFYAKINLKGARAQKIGLKSTYILKYDLGKSLSKEMWCKMADTKKITWLHILKDENACNMR